MRRCWAVLLSAWLLAMTGCAPGIAQQLCVEFYDVGKADAMLITTPQGKRILIDAATDKEGEKLAQTLEDAGVTRVDIMIITHFDKDHVGGADHFLEQLDVGAVYMPVYEKDSKQYTQFVEALEERPQIAVERMPRATEQTLEVEPGLTLRITSAHQADYGEDEENDFSLAVRMTYGQTSFFFTGDAESARQMELLSEGDVACDVLKVPYHGRYKESSEAFLTACSPKIAFIHDSEDDPADERVLAILAELNAETYCAKDSGLRVVSDGQSVCAERLP